jgi:hypothetical protein
VGQRVDQIEANIDGARAELGANLEELERRVAGLTDWRAHFEARPLLFLGIAFAGGAAVAASLGPERAPRAGFAPIPGGEPRRNMPALLHKEYALTTWDNVKGALVGLAIERFLQHAGEIIPGFTDQFRRAERRAASVVRPPAD